MEGYTLNKLKHTLEMAEIAQAFFDVKKGMMFFDNMCCKIHETSESSISILHLMRMYDTNSARKYIERLKKGIAEKETHFDSIIETITEIGKKKWIHVVGVPEYEWGDCTGIQFLYKDVDNETRDKMRMHSHANTMESSFTNATEGLAMVSIGGRFVKANPALCAMLGYTEEELFNKPLIDFVPKEDLQELESILAKFLMGKISQYVDEKEYIDRFGERKRMGLIITITRDDQKRPVRFLFQLTDLTQMYHRQSEIKTLLRLVSDQNKRLIDFAYIVSHNLRTHSGNFTMIMELMKREFPEHTNNYYYPMLKTTARELQKTMEDLTTAIVSYSYNEEDLTQLCLGRQLSLALGSISRELKTIGGTIVNNVPKNICVNHLKTYLLNIFISVLENAIKFRHPDRPIEITIDFEDSGDFYGILIKDNGLGINIEEHANEMFMLYKTFHEKQSGRGVGLFVVKNQMESLHGICEVESVVDEGSVFKLYFKK
ncbi:sensor histidine kinase [Neptunitalea chrysea]|nr:PAS domain S-box protein [Neptunitalea chrysea]